MSPCEPLDCAVVGAGPAGLTAALYLMRFHRRTVLLDDGRSRALAIERSHNVPGFPQGIPGRTLLKRLRCQLQALGGRVTPGRVTALERLPGGFRLRLGPQALQARQVILATGVVDGVPALPGVVQVHARGLLRQCPICDGHEHRGQRIAVLGDGAHAGREARFIAHYSPQVWWVGLDAAAAPAPAEVPPGVQRLPAAARQMQPAPGGGVQLQLHDGSVHRFDVLYAALGTQPRSQLARPLGARLDALGTLEIDTRCSTSVPGLYAAGDVVSGLDQLAVAAGHGALAATAVHNSLAP